MLFGDAWCRTQAIGPNPPVNPTTSLPMIVNRQLLTARRGVTNLSLIILQAVFLTGLLLSTDLQADEAKDVIVTPLGSHDGEFCARDRAVLLQDPNGTRILYDAGRTVAGPEDPRLGDVDIVLVSHLHGDHVGDVHIKEINGGTCAAPQFSNPLAYTNSAEIAASKGSTIVTGSEMPAFLAGKLKAAGGDPEKSKLVRFGGSLDVGGVAITTVPATHSNGIDGSLIGGELGEQLTAAGITAYAGPPTGYVLTFSNGLVVYLSGDTGITAEQQTTVADYYEASMVIMNIGGGFTTGPEEAAFVVNELIKPASVIASHANEEATKDGRLITGTRTEAFSNAVDMEVHVPLSGVAMHFNSDGVCTEGC